MRKNKKRDNSEISNAPKSHIQLTKEAKALKNKTKNKVWCKVFYQTLTGEPRDYIIEAPTKIKLKISQLKHTHKHKHCVVTISEIKNIIKT